MLAGPLPPVPIVDPDEFSAALGLAIGRGCGGLLGADDVAVACPFFIEIVSAAAHGVSLSGVASLLKRASQTSATE